MFEKNRDKGWHRPPAGDDNLDSSTCKQLIARTNSISGRVRANICACRSLKPHQWKAPRANPINHYFCAAIKRSRVTFTVVSPSIVIVSSSIGSSLSSVCVTTFVAKYRECRIAIAEAMRKHRQIRRSTLFPQIRVKVEKSGRCVKHDENSQHARGSRRIWVVNLL